MAWEVNNNILFSLVQFFDFVDYGAKSSNSSFVCLSEISPVKDPRHQSRFFSWMSLLSHKLCS